MRLPFVCQRLPLLSLLWRALSVCQRRRKDDKEKKKEDEDVDLEEQIRVAGKKCKVFPARSWPGRNHGEGSSSPRIDSRMSAPGNVQDADDISYADDLLMPELVIDCARRKGARIHKGTSLILPDAGDDLILGIVAHLPVLKQISPCWHLGYSMAVDGVSLRTLYRQVMEVGPCLLVVEDSNHCIFGVFASEGLRPQNRCHGTHECFLFRFPRHAGAWRAEIFHWSQQPEVSGACDGSDAEGYTGARANFFQALRAQHGCPASSSPASTYCDYTGIVVGIDGPAIFIDQDLLRGVSCPSRVFGSPCMAAVGPDFVVRNLEVWHWIG